MNVDDMRIMLTSLTIPLREKWDWIVRSAYRSCSYRLWSSHFLCPLVRESRRAMFSFPFRSTNGFLFSNGQEMDERQEERDEGLTFKIETWATYQRTKSRSLRFQSVRPLIISSFMLAFISSPFLVFSLLMVSLWKRKRKIAADLLIKREKREGEDIICLLLRFHFLHHQYSLLWKGMNKRILMRK